MRRDPLAQIRRLATNQTMYDDAQPTLRRGGLDAPEVIPGFVCECARPDCERTAVALTVSEYETVRRHARRFVVASREYVFAPLETIVEDNGRYCVAERTDIEATG